MNPRLALFLTGLVQVAMVGLNTWQISHQQWVGCAIVGFIISYIWTWNVKKVAFGTHIDRVIYATGAGVGTLCGLAIAVFIYKVI